MILQSFQTSLKLCPKLNDLVWNGRTAAKKKRKSTAKRQSSSSTDSYASFGSSSRPNSSSLTSSSLATPPLSHSLASDNSLKSTTSIQKFVEKKKNDRGPLKVSINETAELIEDVRDAKKDEEKAYSIDSETSKEKREEREKLALDDEKETVTEKD